MMKSIERYGVFPWKGTGKYYYSECRKWYKSYKAAENYCATLQVKERNMHTQYVVRRGTYVLNDLKDIQHENQSPGLP